MSKGRIHCRKVLPHDRLATLAVTLSNELLDLGYRFLARQHAAEREETRLHDRVDAIAKLTLPRHAVGVDGIDLQPLVDDRLLDGVRQMVPHFRFFIWTIGQ